MFNFISLWIRFVWLILTCALGIILVFHFTKNHAKKIRFIITAVILIIYSIGWFDVGNSIINPQIKTFTGTYESCSRNATGPGPFQIEYCFTVDSVKVYIDTDIISKNILFSEELKEGSLYEISYEVNQNLIVAINSTK